MSYKYDEKQIADLISFSRGIMKGESGKALMDQYKKAIDNVTPFDVIDNLKGNKIGTEVYEGRESIVVEYEEDDMRTKTLVWEYKGLPLKYIEYKNNKKYRTVIFDHLIYNQVSDEQVAHQQLG